MSLHPVFQQALAPFMPMRRAPGRATEGTETFHTSLSDVAMECEIYWEAEEKQTWTEPGWPAQATLQSCLVGGVEILELLSDKQIQQIETAFLEKS